MASKEIIKVFELYQKARVQFVQTVAELANRPRNIESLQAAGAMELLRPLLLDTVPSVQQSAALALGRLANYSDDLAEAVVTGEILPHLVYALSEQNRYYKRSAAFVLRSVAKHSARLAQAVVDSQAVESLVLCLEEFDPGVKEAAAWALGNIVKHNTELAQAVVNDGAIPSLVLCVQEPEISLKIVSCSALSYICSHSAEMAQVVVDSEAIPNLVPLLESVDTKLKRQVCSCLSHIAKHSVELAELVVEGEIFPKIFLLLKDEDMVVQKNAATCIREVAKHTPELSSLVVKAGGVPALVDYISESEGDSKLPAIMTLGFIAAFSETMAASVVKARAIPPLGYALTGNTSDHVKAASAWTLGQIGRHSADHARAVAEADILPKMMDTYLSELSSEDLKNKSKRALKSIIGKCVYLEALDKLLHHQAPHNILKYIVGQYAKIVPDNIEEKKRLVASKGLAELQLIEAEPGSELKDAIDLINSCYPEEVVQYYSPGYSEVLIAKIGMEDEK